ncbi:27828_t:CDS:1, partial [Racocetra persica]
IPVKLTLMSQRYENQDPNPYFELVNKGTVGFNAKDENSQMPK